MSNCNDCRWWEAYDEGRTTGVCAALDVSRPARRYPPPGPGDEPQDRTARIAINTTWDEVKTSEYDMLTEYGDEISAVLETGPDFGCVQFAAKE